LGDQTAYLDKIADRPRKAVEDGTTFDAARSKNPEILEAIRS